MAFGNYRVFYASHALSVNGTTVQGGQSVSVNTNFNLENIFQLGRLAVYDNVALDPEVEVTINKALDGHPTVYTLATGGGSLVASSNAQATLRLGVGKDTDEELGATVAERVIKMTGCYISSLNYTFPVDGNFSEEITFLGTSKSLETGTVAAPGPNPLPAAPANQSNVLRRQNFKKGSSDLPSEVSGKRLSQVTISADLGREALYELGKFAPYHRFVNFPLEITVAFDVIADDHDAVEAELADLNECEAPAAEGEQAIKIVLCRGDGAETYTFDLGEKCTLQSVSYSGGDTGGGNVTITYTYLTYNTLTITG